MLDEEKYKDLSIEDMRSLLLDKDKEISKLQTSLIEVNINNKVSLEKVDELFALQEKLAVMDLDKRKLENELIISNCKYETLAASIEIDRINDEYKHL
jgi:hypothetical protein